MVTIKITKLSDNTIRIEEYENGALKYGMTWPALFRATYNPQINLVSISSNTIPGFMTLSTNPDKIEIDGTLQTSGDEAAAALNEFIGNFNPAGGTARTTLPSFEANRTYTPGEPITAGGAIWTAKTGFTSGDDFDPADWNKVSISTEEMESSLEKKLDQTEDENKIYGTNENGEQTTYDLSGFERSRNKTDQIKQSTLATDTHYPSELAVRTELDTKLDKEKTSSSTSKFFHDTDGESGHSQQTDTTISASTAKTAPSSPIKLITYTKDAITHAGTRLIHTLEKIYYTQKSDESYTTTDEIVTLKTLNETMEPISLEIQGLHGKTARLNGYDFGMDITAANISETDIQTLLTAYALVQLGLSDATGIPNFIGVHNLYSGEGGNHLLVFNQAIPGSSTPENPEFPAHWVDNGLDSVSTASNTSLGVVKGSETDMKIEVGSDGTMSVNGLSGALGNKIDRTGDESRVYGTDEYGEQTTYDLDSFGKVDTVNGILPDTSKNVQTEYVYETEAAFEADRDNIPIGATVIKLYEYPDNFAGFMTVPDYANKETVNRFSGYNTPWTADRSGFVALSGVARNGTGTDTLSFTVNGVLILNNRIQLYAGLPEDKLIYSTLTAVARGDVINCVSGFPNVSPVCYFIPPRFIKEKLPVVVVQPDSDYSLTEQPVLINDNGVVRQKLDLDGSPVWTRVFTFSDTIAANTTTNRSLMTGVKRIVSYHVEHFVDTQYCYGDIVLFTGTGTSAGIRITHRFLLTPETGLVRSMYDSVIGTTFTVEHTSRLEYTKQS